ncbi:MAG: enoyl-CoA hydratase [Xanthobacteraceae bacterium]
MTASSVLIEERPFPGCCLLSLNRPSAMNAMSLDLRRALVATFDALEKDPEVRVAILTGAGKAFSAGLDLKEIGSHPDAASVVIPEPSDDPLAAMARFSGPVIGAINGVAMTGGFELALACDVLIASTQARFADTHVRVGVLPGWGLSQRLPRLIGPLRAKELSLTGRFLDAAEALAWGLVNRVVEPDDLLPQSFALARQMLDARPDMLVAYKRLIDDGLGTSFAEGLALERQRSIAWAAGARSSAFETDPRKTAPRG